MREDYGEQETGQGLRKEGARHEAEVRAVRDRESEDKFGAKYFEEYT